MLTAQERPVVIASVDLPEKSPTTRATGKKVMSSGVKHRERHPSDDCRKCRRTEGLTTSSPRAISATECPPSLCSTHGLIAEGDIHPEESSFVGWKEGCE